MIYYIKYLQLLFWQINAEKWTKLEMRKTKNKVTDYYSRTNEYLHRQENILNFVHAYITNDELLCAKKLKLLDICTNLLELNSNTVGCKVESQLVANRKQYYHVLYTALICELLNLEYRAIAYYRTIQNYSGTFEIGLKKPSYYFRSPKDFANDYFKATSNVIHFEAKLLEIKLRHAFLISQKPVYRNWVGSLKAFAKLFRLKKQPLLLDELPIAHTDMA